MQVESLLLREFEAGVLPAKLVRKKPFSSGSKEEEAPLPPPAPTFSEEELAEAKRDAYQSGFLAGSKDGHASAQSEHSAIEKTLSETLEKFAQSVSPIFENYKTTVQNIRADMPLLALAVAKKVAGNALNNSAMAVIEAATMNCVEAMISEPKIFITVHESLSKELNKKIQSLALRLQSAGHISVQGDANIPLSDYRAEWKGGSMERVTERLLQQVDSVVSDMLQTIARDTGEQMDLLSVKIEEASNAPLEELAEPQTELLQE